MFLLCLDFLVVEYKNNNYKFYKTFKIKIKNTNKSCFVQNIYIY